MLKIRIGCSIPVARVILVLPFISLALTHLSGDPQVTNPNSVIYKDLGEWEARGLTQPAFMLRPYPPVLIKEMLAQVVERGTPKDRVRAQAWLDSFDDGKDISFASKAEGLAQIGIEKKAVELQSGQALHLAVQLLPWLWGGGAIGLYAYDEPVDVFYPAGEYLSRDATYFNADLPISGINGTLRLVMDIESALFAGTSGIWAGAALGRSSFGPFWENGVVVGPQAPGTVNYTLQGRFGKWRFSMGMFELVAEEAVENDTSTQTSKRAMLHSFSYSPTPAWDFGIFEAVVYANRFDPAYLLPLGCFFLQQAMSGYDAEEGLTDNSLAGLYATWRFTEGWRAKALVFMDDMGFNDIIKLNWDTKWLFSGQAGLEWAPPDSRVRRVSLDYTAVMPYMYSHYYAEGYQNNWTNYGENWGPALLPNSDRVEARARIDLGEGYDLELVGRFMRHGNASDGVSSDGKDTDIQNGGLYDDGWFTQNGTYNPSYQSPYDTGTSPAYFRFLTQPLLEYTAQLGLGVSRSFPLGKANLELSARYLLELVWNECGSAGDPVAGDDEARNYLRWSATLSY